MALDESTFWDQLKQYIHKKLNLLTFFKIMLNCILFEYFEMNLMLNWNELCPFYFFTCSSCILSSKGKVYCRHCVHCGASDRTSCQKSLSLNCIRVCGCVHVCGANQVMFTTCNILKGNESLVMKTC